MTTFLWYLLVIFVISAIGGLLPLVKSWSKNSFRLIISFGAGVLIGTCFFHMLPVIIQPLGSNVGIPVIIGFFIIYILERFIMVHSCEEDVCDFHTVGISAFLGISFHSLIDGLSMGVGFIVKDIGLMIFLAIIIHKFPSALSLTGILIQGGYKKTKIIQLAIIFALTTPIGAIITLSVLNDLPEYTLSWSIGISAGTFLYIAISDLLPYVHQHNPRKYFNLASLMLGLLLMWFGKYLF